VTLCGPAAIAVHNDGNVPRHYLPLMEAKVRKLRLALSLAGARATVEDRAQSATQAVDASLGHGFPSDPFSWQSHA
jgi:hypothetical protein